MKKGILLFFIVCASCAAVNRRIPDSQMILSEHPAPLKIFGIGRYSSSSMILTLVDSKSNYFTIETALDTSLKIGAVYPKVIH